MTPDEIDAALKRIFPGDPVPDVDEDGVVWVQRETTSRGPRLAAYTPTPVRESHRVLPEFERLMTAPVPTVPRNRSERSEPSAPQRQYLIESPAHVARWLDEAKEIESDVKLGLPAEPHRVTRLMLEAIPVVEKFTT